MTGTSWASIIENVPPKYVSTTADALEVRRDLWRWDIRILDWVREIELYFGKNPNGTALTGRKTAPINYTIKVSVAQDGAVTITDIEGETE